MARSSVRMRSAGLAAVLRLGWRFHLGFTRKTANSVTKLNADTGVVAITVTVGTAPSYLCFDGTYIWVANTGSNNLTKIKASDNSVQSGTYNVQGPRGICFDGSALWVCSFSANTVVKLDPRNGAVLGTFAVGAQPEAICFDGTSIWVANQGANNVTRLDLNGAVIGTYAVETAPAGIVFDGRAIWVTNSGSNTVSQLDYTTGQLSERIRSATVPQESASTGTRFGSPTKPATTSCAGKPEPPPNLSQPTAMRRGFGREGRPTPKQSLGKVSGRNPRRIRHLSA